MLFRRLEVVFALVVAVAVLMLAYNYYQDYRFDNTHLSHNVISKIEAKKAQLMQKVYQHYGVWLDVSVVISDEMPQKLYGVCALEKNGRIVIYLNKKRFKESENYIIDDVLPHEYAHAVMFHSGDLHSENEGHSKQWQEACIKLGGVRCNRFVDHNDVVLGKLPF